VPAGEGAYRVMGEAMRPLQLKYVLEVDVGMRALFDQEEWLGVDGRSAARQALGQAGEAMSLG
jgi:hypothetical protein